ncbi:MAG: response regulator [Pseudomonadales bacterium]|nr:response regulator [Pseudomonadales bacterium]MBO7004282.1 response regulator [Pseudomonadales bacterium]
MNEFNEYLEPYRRNVLVIIRYAALLTTLMNFLVSMAPWGLENVEPSQYALLGLSIAYCAICFVIRERHIRLQAAISSVVLFCMCLLLLYSVGPVYSAGILAMSWVAWVVFFHNQLILPLFMMALCFSCIAVAESHGLTPVWSSGDITVEQWLSMWIVQFLPMAGGGYLLQQMIFGLIRSLVRETAARKRELDIQREKELIDQALMQRYRLESVGRLASGVAHDFNNILTVLLSCMEVLRVVNDKPTRDGVLNDMEAALRSAEATSRQLLSLSSNNGAGEPAQPRTSLRSLIANLKRLFPENISIEEYVRGTPRVALPSGEFEQIILNLCINARDSMPDGGVLTINAFEQPGDDLVIVEILDTGTGMSEEILAKAIDPFFTTKVERDGTGLGLSQVYASIQNVGGDIQIQSTVGIGTRVRLLLPVAEPIQVNMDVSQEREASLGDDKRVLLLDDDELVSITMSRALASAGYDVTSANSVSQAIDHLDNEPFQILITDRGLPDGDPGRVVSKFKALSDGPVLLISGYETDDPLEAQVSFLQKPFAPSTLLRKLTEMSEALRA